MTRIPRTVKVGPHTYRIKRVGTKEFPKHQKELMGCCDYNENLVYMLRGMNLEKSQEILLHELLHACCYPSLIDVQLDDELFVDNMAPHLLQMLQDNPRLVAYLTQKKESHAV